MKKRYIIAFFFITVTACGLVHGPTAAAASATGGYPYAAKPCIWKPLVRYSTTPHWCSDYDWGDRPGDESAANVISPYGYYYRNCTDYAAWRLDGLGVSPALYKGLGNAKSWGTNAARKGLWVDSRPAPGTIAVRTSGVYGHAAFVEEVLPDGRIRVSQYNYRADGNFSSVVGTAAAFGFTQFIHFGVEMKKPEPPLPPPPPPPPAPEPEPVPVPVSPSSPEVTTTAKPAEAPSAAVTTAAAPVTPPPEPAAEELPAQPTEEPDPEPEPEIAAGEEIAEAEEDVEPVSIEAYPVVETVPTAAPVAKEEVVIPTPQAVAPMQPVQAVWQGVAASISVSTVQASNIVLTDVKRVTWMDDAFRYSIVPICLLAYIIRELWHLPGVFAKNRVRID